MTIRKRFAAGALAALLCLGLLTSCGKGKTPEALTLSVSMGDTIATLDPIWASDPQELTVLTHLYENLLKLSANAEGETVVSPGMAKNYDVKQNTDGTFTYTFHLRQAKWSDGVPVKAQDFVYAWQRLANPASQSPNAALLSPVKGFRETQLSGDVSHLAVEAKNDSTLIVTLAGSCEWFLTDVCTAPATSPLRESVVQKLKEEANQVNEELSAAGGSSATATWCSDHTKLVTNGPYIVSESNLRALRLEHSETYSSSAKGPQTIEFLYTGSSEDAWELYEAGDLDFVDPLPTFVLAEDAEAETPATLPALSTCALLFNTSSELFSDPLARDALALVLDRTVLSQAAGPWTWPATGLVPYGVPDSAAEDFRGHGGELLSSDPEIYAAGCATALDNLEQAGYGNVYRFPHLECYYAADTGKDEVVSAMAAMWQEQLGISVEPTALSREDLALTLATGAYLLAVTDITSPINDAEGFLTTWQSSNRKNVVGYCNSAFDTLLTVIGKANNDTARRGCLHDSESLLIDDCPLTPLYFNGTGYRLRHGLVGLCRDARGFYSFATVAEVSE